MQRQLDALKTPAVTVKDGKSSSTDAEWQKRVQTLIEENDRLRKASSKGKDSEPLKPPDREHYERRIGVLLEEKALLQRAGPSAAAPRSAFPSNARMRNRCKKQKRFS